MTITHPLIPNLAGIAPADMVETIGTGKYAASYINWARTVQLLREHAPGWLPELVPAADGGVLHPAPNGSYLLVRFRHGDFTTPPVPQAVMDNRNQAIPLDKINARDITDTHRRGVCMAAAFTFGLAYELWAKLPMESGYHDEPQREPDMAAILYSISKSMSMNVLKTSYEAAMQMLAPEHHPAIKKAASTRKAELASQPTEETT